MRSCIEEAWVWCFVFSCNQEIDLAVLPAHLLPIELRLWHSQLVQCNLGRAQTMIYKDILIYTFSRGWKRSSRKWIYKLFQRINFSVENFKKTRNLDGSSPEPRYSHVILISGYPVIDSNMNVQHQVARSHSRNNVRHCLLVSLWCGRKDVRSRDRLDRQPNCLSWWVRLRALSERVELR